MRDMFYNYDHDIRAKAKKKSGDIVNATVNYSTSISFLKNIKNYDLGLKVLDGSAFNFYFSIESENMEELEVLFETTSFVCKIVDKAYETVLEVVADKVYTGLLNVSVAGNVLQKGTYRILLEAHYTEPEKSPFITDIDVTALTDGCEIDADDFVTTVTCSNIELEYVDIDPSVGRNSAGYYVGAKVLLPDDVNPDSVRLKTTRRGQFVNYTDLCDENYGLVLWAGLSEKVIKRFRDNHRPYMYYYWYFDLNGDDEIDKVVAIKLDYETITLVDNDEVNGYDVPETPAIEDRIIPEPIEGLIFSGPNNILSVE